MVSAPCVVDFVLDAIFASLLIRFAALQHQLYVGLGAPCQEKMLRCTKFTLSFDD